MKLDLELSRPAKTRNHLIKHFSEFTHLVATRSRRDTKIEVTLGNAAGCAGKFTDRSRKLPNKDSRDQGCSQQDRHHVNQGPCNVNVPNTGWWVWRTQNDNYVPPSMIGINGEWECSGCTGAHLVRGRRSLLDL